MAKILYFYPDNPLIINQGNNARAHKLLHYFKSRNFTVDFVGEQNRSGSFTPENIDELKQTQLIRNGYLLPKKIISGLRYLLGTSIPTKITRYPKGFQRVTYNQINAFKAVLKENEYDYIIISYVLFAPFIKDRSLTKGAKLIVDTHDFFTGQFYNPELRKPDLGRLFNTEINLLNLFDVIWSISPDEHFVFSQFLPSKTILTIPHGEQDKSHLVQDNRTIDVFYVGSNNPHNLNAARWFFEKVYPLLPEHINITVVGRVNQVIPDLPRVTKITFVEDLATCYQQSKITICPMLTGTGLKIKVVESLSYGLPVVCNARGLDGLSSKINNGCLATNDPERFAEHIVDLIDKPEFYKKHSQEATAFFRKTLEEQGVFQTLDDFFQKP